MPYFYHAEYTNLVCLFTFYWQFFFFFFYVANRHSWDADWSQVGNLETVIGHKSALETLIGSRAVYQSRACDVQGKHSSFTACAQLQITI